MKNQVYVINVTRITSTIKAASYSSLVEKLNAIKFIQIK